MPDKRQHRGPHPEDGKLFAPEALGGLRSAMADYAMLLSKGYAQKSSLKLVGDRFSLTERQRIALMRSTCSDEQLASRLGRRVALEDIAGRRIAIDGYNVLITIEAAMSGAVILKGRDGCCRDLASIHGTYRKVSETIPAVELFGRFLWEIGVREALWLLDKPVSNSGRLKTLIGELAEENDWPWEVELAMSPDAALIKGDTIAATSDSAILDACKEWFNLATEIISSKLDSVWLIDLSD